MAEPATLKNGVWLHETEWAAIKELIRAVDAWAEAPDPEAVVVDTSGIMDALMAWRTVHLDIAEETRAIQSLTKMVDALSESVSDDVPSPR